VQPSGKDIYRHFLNPNVRAVLRLKNRTINLQDAINDSLVTVTGKKYDLKEFFGLVSKGMTDNRRTDEDKAQDKKLLDLWNRASEAERNNIDLLFNLKNYINAKLFDIPDDPNYTIYPIIVSWPYLPDSIKKLFNAKYDTIIMKPIREQVREQLLNIRDFSQLTITNNTGGEVELIFDEDIYLGISKENIDCLLKINGGQSLNDQQEIWHRQNSARLDILKNLNCVNDKISENTDRLKDAVKCFQKKNNLEQTGIIDEKTEILLCDEYKRNKKSDLPDRNLK
jgi:hypothetical protein